MTKRGPRGNPKDVLIGDRFDRWSVLGTPTKHENGQTYFLCVCDCGTEREVIYRTLREIKAGKIDGSCGCRHKEVMAAKRKHGVKPGTTEYHKARWIWREYKLTLQDWQSLYDKQQGLCAICGEDLSKGRIHLDHNHKTGSVRSLLCHHCNVGIGHFKEDVNILLKAIAYLQAER